MPKIQSFDIEKDDARGRERSPYGIGAGGPTAIHFSTNTARVYSMFCLALLVFYGAVQKMFPVDDSEEESASKGDAAGGWVNRPVVSSSGSMKDGWNAPVVTHYHERPQSHSASNTIDAVLEMRESDLLMVLSPLVYVPSHPRPEYEKYQRESDNDDIDASVYSEDILYDKQTPHGMAFDFMLNRDKRPISDELQVIQRFVLTLLFFATGGKDESLSPPESYGERSSGWDSNLAHFLTGLHECHWVKKSVEDQFWGVLSIENGNDRRVGVTKCNSDMEVTEIRLADLNLIGFVPEEIKWLQSLESLDMQNNHLFGPIPVGLGELDALRYLSLDGNNFTGTIPDVFHDLSKLERAYLNFNDFNGAMPPSFCSLREEGALKDLWSDCGGYPITCTCCTVCCDMVAECNEMESQKGG